MMPEEFNLTEDHITLLRRSYVSPELSGVETGAAEIDGKRPYGNSDVDLDVAEILGWADAPGWDDQLDEDGQLPEAWVKKAMELHEQTPVALQIVLSTGSFVPGLYRRSSRYDTTTWELQS